MNQPLRIVVDMDDQGRIAVQCTGPGSENKVAILGLLELVKSGIAAPPPMPTPVVPPLLIANGRLPDTRRN